MSENKTSEYDPGQITRMGFCDVNKAHRVVIEGSGITIPEIRIPEIKFPDNLKIENKVIEIIKEVPVYITQVEIREIEKPVYIKEHTVEIKEIIKEVPVIKEVLKIEVVEKPVIIVETKIEMVEKPIIIEKIQEKMTSLAYGLICSQAVGIIILTILLLKK